METNEAAAPAKRRRPVLVVIGIVLMLVGLGLGVTSGLSWYIEARQNVSDWAAQTWDDIKDPPEAKPLPGDASPADQQAVTPGQPDSPLAATRELYVAIAGGLLFVIGLVATIVGAVGRPPAGEPTA